MKKSLLAKAIAIIVAIVLLVNILPTTAFAAEDFISKFNLVDTKGTVLQSGISTYYIDQGDLQVVFSDTGFAKNVYMRKDGDSSTKVYLLQSAENGKVIFKLPADEPEGSYRFYYTYFVGSGYSGYQMRSVWSGKTIEVKQKKPVDNKVSSVTLNKTTLALCISKSATLKEMVSPANAKNKAVSWKSSNTKVATVKGGKVTAKAKGTATITVITVDGAKKAICKVTVGKVQAKMITLKKTATIRQGNKLTLKPIITPKNTDPKTITWTSSNKKIATVSSKGVVKGINTGKATITAKTWNGKKSKCTVTVK